MWHVEGECGRGLLGHSGRMEGFPWGEILLYNLKDGEEGSRSIFLHFSFYLLPGVLFFLFHNKQQIAPYKDLISVVHTERIETDILHFPRVRLYF